jgi:hypothetical protein
VSDRTTGTAPVRPLQRPADTALTTNGLRYSSRPEWSVEEPCNHIDAYGSMVMEGGPHSAHPGRLMCIGCDELVPLLRVVA